MSHVMQRGLPLYLCMNRWNLSVLAYRAQITTSLSPMRRIRDY